MLIMEGFSGVCDHCGKLVPIDSSCHHMTQQQRRLLFFKGATFECWACDACSASLAEARWEKSEAQTVSERFPIIVAAQERVLHQCYERDSWISDKWSMIINAFAGILDIVELQGRFDASLFREPPMLDFGDYIRTILLVTIDEPRRKMITPQLHDEMVFLPSRFYRIEKNSNPERPNKHVKKRNYGKASLCVVGDGFNTGLVVGPFSVYCRQCDRFFSSERCQSVSSGRGGILVENRKYGWDSKDDILCPEGHGLFTALTGGNFYHSSLF